MDTSVPRGAQRPSALMEWLLVVAMAVVARLPGIFLGSALLGLAVLGLVVAGGGLDALVVPLTYAAIVVLGTVADRDRGSLPGRAVRPADEPELAALVGDVAERLGFRAPLLVRVVPEPEAALGPVKLSGVRGCVLLLGLPLLRSMTAAQLAAVVAHELAHEQHVRDRRTVWLRRTRDALAERLGGRFRPPAALALPLLRASRPSLWEAEFAADADSARIAGAAATGRALELADLLGAVFDGLGERWLSELEEDGARPQDFYDAFEAALRDPFVLSRGARAAAEEDAFDPYAAAGRPPTAQRVAALPDGGGAGPYGTEPVVLRDAQAIEQWCVEELAGDTGSGRGAGRAGDGVGLRPVRILDPDTGPLLRPDDGAVELLLGATRRKSPVPALSDALDAVADGSWPDLASGIEPGLRRVPAPERRYASRAVLARAAGETLAAVLRDSGWTYAGRWSSTVLAAPDGTAVDLHEMLVAALDSGDPAPVRALVRSAGKERTEA
ncbi:hypothetical protein ACFW9F_24860 [Streptomyces sp. NPDC059506]|uniref:hypothetical protein n=1 Tax=Streptomyces sp. NPDC059506 TaxID=3347751 RepID=UPI00369BEA87